MKILTLAAILILAVASAAGQQFQVMEASIADIHDGLQSGKLSCRSLVQQYLGRINAYDQQGPALNAMLYVNHKAIEQADAMDKAFKRGAKLKPLQCVPLVLKDVFDTADMPTTGGSLALKGMQPAKDAFTVTRFRQNGAGVATLERRSIGRDKGGADLFQCGKTSRHQSHRSNRLP